MKEYFRRISTLLFVLAILFTNTFTVFASGEDGGHLLEIDVNGYHIALSSQDEWVRGENVVVVTITDAMGMPVSNAEVEILIAPEADSHAQAGSDSDGESETDAHAEPAANEPGSESSHDSMSEMDEHEAESSDVIAHDEATVTPLVMLESHEHGEYVAEAHLEKSGKHIVQVFFHVNGEMMQADFIVDIPGMASKTVVLWSFLLINVGLIVSAGVIKYHAVPVKGK